VLKSAVANADHNFGMDVDKLFVVKAVADQGLSCGVFVRFQWGVRIPIAIERVTSPWS
jgi:hypothetical protein